jgi:hypothetical protein
MNVKGTVLLARRAFVQKHFGQEAWEQVLNSLGAEDRGRLNGILLSVAWFPFKLSERLDEAIVRILGQGDESVFERIGQVSAEENLSGAHKHFLAAGSPEKFLRQTPAIYKFYYDSGYRTYEPDGADGAVLTTYDADTFSHVDCLTVIGWHKRALQMCGAREVEMREEACRARGADTCRYRIKWRV